MNKNQENALKTNWQKRAPYIHDYAKLLLSNPLGSFKNKIFT